MWIYLLVCTGEYFFISIDLCVCLYLCVSLFYTCVFLFYFCDCLYVYMHFCLRIWLFLDKHMDVFEIERAYMCMFEYLCLCMFSLLVCLFAAVAVEVYLSKYWYRSSCVWRRDYMSVWLCQLICVCVNVCMNLSVYDCFIMFTCKYFPMFILFSEVFR